MTEHTNESAQQNNTIYIIVPAKIGKETPSIKPWQYTHEGKEREMVEVTLPYGTVIDGEDVSFYKFSVPKFQLDPGGQKYPYTHSIRQNADKETGEYYPLQLERDFGQYDADQVWQPDVKKVTVSPEVLRDTLKEQYMQYKQTRDANKEQTVNPTEARIADSKKSANEMNASHQKSAAVKTAETSHA